MNFFDSHITSITFGIYSIIVLAIVVLTIFEKRSPLRTISWVLVVVLLPVIGVTLYLFLGQEYRKKKMFSRKGLKGLEDLKILTQQQLVNIPSETKFPHLDVINKNKHIISLLLANSNALLTTDNRVRILKNGSEKFPAIFDAIRKAKKHIHIEYYIIDNDELGNKFRELLIEKAKEGIEVRLIYDDVGSWSLSKKYLKSMKNAGVHVDCFMRIRFPHFTSKANYRNHRKIIVIDGTIAFVGGINIADRYLHGTKKLGEWRDTHVMLEGGAATMLQVQFMADWYFVSKEVLGIKKYFTPLSNSTSGKAVQILSGGPDSDWATINQFYFSAITSAKKHIYITTPYLIPTNELTNALKIAALSLIDVRILLPQNGDSVMPKWSTYSYIDELLEAGVKIYFYSKGFVHAKLIMVDGELSSIGTANFDFRSLETNFEVNAVIYDTEVTQQLELQFKEDLANSKHVTEPLWRRRPYHYKIKEAFARLLGPLL